MAATWLLSVGAGISLLAGGGGGLYFLAFGVLLGIALEVAAAWSLIVWIGKDTRGTDAMPSREHAAGSPAGQSAASTDELQVAELSNRQNSINPRRMKWREAKWPNGRSRSMP